MQWTLLYFEIFYTIYNICIRSLLIFVRRVNTIQPISIVMCGKILNYVNISMHESGCTKEIHNYVDDWSRWKFVGDILWDPLGCLKEEVRNKGRKEKNVPFVTKRDSRERTIYLDHSIHIRFLFEVPSAFEAKHLGLQLPSSIFFFCLSLSPSSFDGPLF